MSVRARIQVATEGFGAPVGIDPHRFEVRVPSGNKGDVSIVEHFGVAISAYGSDAIERCTLSRRAWGAIRDDVKRHFNERLKDKSLPSGALTTGANKVERLLGHELMVLAWAVEAAKIEMIPVAVRNWLAMRPEERWWLFAVTAASTGEARHREIGWRKALRFALTENPVREALRPAQPKVDAETLTLREKLSKGRRAADVERDLAAPRLPGLEEEASPFLQDMTVPGGLNGDSHDTAALVEGCAIADRAGDTGTEDIGRSAKRAKGRSKPDADSARLLLEGPKASRSGQGVRARRAAASHR